KVVDNSGLVYAADSLTQIKAFGTTITDIGFYGADVPIVLSGQTLTAYSQSILPTGSVTLNSTPADVLVNSTDVITFTPDATSSASLRGGIVHLWALHPATRGQPVNPIGLAYTPDKIEQAAD